MIKVVNKFLLAEDNFMHEMHLRHTELTYCVCGPFIKNKERIQKLKKIEDSKYIHKNELGQACFQYDMAYRNLKDLPRRATADRVLQDKASNFVKNKRYDGYQRGLASMVCKFFIKKQVVLLMKSF